MSELPHWTVITWMILVSWFLFEIGYGLWLIKKELIRHNEIQKERNHILAQQAYDRERRFE